MKKRIITLILAILTCFSSIFGFVGCVVDKEFTVTFVPNREGAVLADRFDESVLVQTVSHYSELIIPVFVCEDAYHYAWNRSIAGINYDITLKATWKNNDFTVIFSPGAEDATLVSGEEKCEANSTMSIKFPKYARQGYTLDETWGGVDLQTITIPTDETNPTIYFTAKWIPNEYGISFVDDDGETELFEKKIVSYSLGIGELPTPTKAGKKFAGWRILGSSTVVSSEKIYNYLEDITLQAVWVEEGHYLISYFDVEEVNNPLSYSGEYDVKLNNPSKVGYNFIGWSGTGIDGISNEVTIPKGAYGNLEFTANWEIKDYGVTLDHGNGQTSQITTVYGNKVGALPTPQKEGFQFVGWYTQNGTEITEETTWLIDDASVYLEAKYLRVYTIKYVLECYVDNVKVVSKFANENIVANKYGLVKSEDEENVWILSGVIEGTVLKEEHISSPTPIESKDYWFSSWRYNGDKNYKVNGGTLVNEKTFPGSYESGVITFVAHCFSYWTPFY